MKHYEIAGDRLKATFRTAGAELCSLRTQEGLELLWSGDPAVWARQAPNLFPVVGAVREDRILHHGQAYPMPKHGFARDLEWTLARQSAHALTLRLVDGPGTREHYPFPFRLECTARVSHTSLQFAYELANPGSEPLPASLGAHPAFRWPLLPKARKEEHWLEFEKPEAELMASVDPQGLLRPQSRVSPLNGRILKLQEDLFQQDALVFPQVRSRTLRYSAPGAPTLQVAWDGFQDLGVWSRPGGDFLCIEPWRGHADPADFQGEFSEKPGSFQVAPGRSVVCKYTISVLPPDVP